MTTETVTRPVVLETADGERREARTWPDGSYSCPFCSAAVMSPDGWAESQRLNAECYARSGDAYELVPYPAGMAAVWESRGCCNPACLVNATPAVCADIRARREARDAEESARKRNHELAMERIAEGKAREREACQAAAVKCQAEGFCYKCWSHSTYGGMSEARVRWIRHRTPESCPRLRTRYGI